MEFAPVVLFVYNRFKHTQATVEALKANVCASETELFIYSDGPKKTEHNPAIAEIRRYLSEISGFKKVTLIAREHNYGLARNIIEGVTQIVNKYGRIIVLEDDLITSPYFLQYMNEALEVYENEPKVISIEGYTYPTKTVLPETFFIKGADCWGWATWKRGWDLFESDGPQLLRSLTETDQAYEFDFNGNYPFTKMLQYQVEGKINSWAIRWYASAFLQNMYTLYPGRSLVFNAGADGSGTHVGVDDVLNVKLSTTPVKVSKLDIRQSEEAFHAFARFYHKLYNPSLFYRARRYLKSLIARQKIVYD